MKPTILEDNLIGIRQFRPGDAPLLFEAVQESAEELRLFMTWCHQGYSLKDCRTFLAKCGSDWQKGKQYNFAIVDIRDQTLLGSAGLTRVDWVNRFANIGYWVRHSRTRLGIAPTAARLIAVFGLKKLGLHRLEILIPGHNLASQRVAEKVGAKFEGVLRNRVILANKLHDAHLYSLVLADLAKYSPQISPADM